MCRKREGLGRLMPPLVECGNVWERGNAEDLPFTLQVSLPDSVLEGLAVEGNER
jgi:hypothetical protein